MPALSAFGVSVPASMDASSASRIGWVDTAKGVGIVLVVAGHAIGGLIDAGLVQNGSWLRPAFLAIYLFHMPLFFILSGLFICQRISQGSAGLLERSVTSLVWPYILWGTLQTLVIYAASGYVNNPVSNPGEALLLNLVSPPSQFWFLYVLFVQQLLALVFIPLIRPAGFFLLSVTALLAVSLYNPTDMPVVPGMTVQMLPWFALGALVGSSGWVMAAIPAMSRRWRLMLCLLAAALVVVFFHKTMQSPAAANLDRLAAAHIARLAWDPGNSAAACAGAVLVIMVAAVMPRLLRAWFDALGRRSMAIYLLHILAIAGSRIILVNSVGLQQTGSLLAILMAAGIVLPLVASFVARRLGINRLLAL